ncbi:MAG TPA: hypothetical protein PK156_21430 [Polyangium sp.]|nr:hypothetical protein [Polyangium sp.]
MPSIHRTRKLALSVMVLGLLPLTEIETASAQNAPISLPTIFTATLQNNSRNGITNECLIYGGNGQQPYPERYLWSSDNGNCGLPSEEFLLDNKQAVFRFESLGNGLYTIANASRNGNYECMMFYGTDMWESPSRYDWGAGNGNCGFSSKAALLANKQAVFRLTPRGGNKFTITHALTNQCLIHSNNGQRVNPTRHLWPLGANANCGLATEQELFDNKAAIWTLTVREDLTPPPPPVISLPSEFTATLQNASRDGITNECLIYGGNGQQPYPERYLWSSDNGNCGLPSEEFLLDNKQAVFRFKNLGGDLYTIANASRNGNYECMMFYGTDMWESPSRYDWGAGNGNCGFSSKAALLANKQAVFRLTPRGGNKFTITHALTNQCLIHSNNGQRVNPTRHLWPLGANANCGLSTEQELFDNQAAIWTLTVREDISAAQLPQEMNSNGQRIFRTSGTGSPLSFAVNASAVVDHASSVSINGAVTVRGSDDDPGIVLANANIVLEFDQNGYVDTLLGSAKVSLPNSDSLSGLTFGDLLDVTVGFASGATLEEQEIEAPLKDDRHYLFYHLATGLSASYGPISFSAPGGTDTLIVVNPRDPSIYFHGDLPSIRGFGSAGNVGIGLSASGLLPFEYANTWGIENVAQPFDGNLLIQASGELPTRLPLELNGEVMIRMPNLNNTSDPLRFGMNGDIGLEISFAKDMATFSLPLGQGSVGGQFGASSGQDDVYFSGGIEFEDILDALPGTFPIKLDAGIKAAGRLSGVPANNFLHLNGHATYGGYGVQGADLIFNSSALTASGRFFFPGFSANLSGTVTPFSANLYGQAQVNITIPATQQVQEWTIIGYQTITNGAICGYDQFQCGTQWVASAFVSGACYVAKGFCDTTSWCDPPPECLEPVWCNEPRSCSQAVWDLVTTTRANPVTFAGTANIQVTSPNNITLNDPGIVCPPGVGICTLSGENLTTNSPQACVTTTLFGKFCTPLAAN